MADYKVTDTQLSGIADAIRSVIGTSDPIVFPSGFVSAVQDIPTPSGSIGISANGTYNVMSYASAVVDVPAPSGSINISQNGTFDVSSFANAVVSVEGGSAVLESLAVSQNGHYTPSAGIDGFNDVVVNVSGGGGSNDNFKIAVGAMSGSVYDSELLGVAAYAFYSNKSITGVEMTAVTEISASAFCACSMLAEASFQETTQIYAYAFSGCTNLSKFTAPKITYLGSYALRSCAVEDVSFPLLASVGQAAFQQCQALSEAILPELSFNATGGLFSGCSNLALVSLPKLPSIVASTFYDCRKLESLYLLSDSVTTLTNKNALVETPMSNSSYLGHFGSIYVPSSLVETYKSANNWSLYADRITSYVEP